MSSRVLAGRGAAREDGGNLIREPLLAKGDGSALLATVVDVGNNAHGGGRGVRAKGAGQDRYWEEDDVQQPDAAAADLESGGGRPLLFSTKKVRVSLLYPYRILILVRLVAVVLFIGWRIKHNSSDVMWFWAVSVAGDVWFAFSWALYQLPKYRPVKRCPDLAALRRHFADDGSDDADLPGVDVYVTTADPVSEPVLYTMNCVLSVLAVDYPADRCACYLADDSGALVLYEALVETVRFAALWTPFCRKHSVEPRAPDSYFFRPQKMENMVVSTTNGRSSPSRASDPQQFVTEYKHVLSEYEKLKARLETLPDTIRERSDVYNSMTAKEEGGVENATWMANGTQWPGAWVEPAEDHRKGHHAGIVQIVQGQEHPSLIKPHQVQVDARLPMVVYVSREKSPIHEHNKKAGALNAQLRVSALLSNAPFVINLDCDHYVNSSQAFRAAMCFFLDARQGGDDTAFVQAPQRFENVDPTDRYGNHNRVFFDGAMYALDGLQGPTYLGTGCMFRRVALYGVDPPRWRTRPDIEEEGANRNRFGDSVAFVRSVSAALKQERRRVVPPLESLDEQPSLLAEVARVVSSSYDQGTDWGRGTGYVYGIATEDIVTGYRIHGQGWRSAYCTMEEDVAFRGTAPINLTERLYQIVRWSGGSLEVFFSPYNPLCSGRRLHPIQRAVYLNFTIYPVTSLFILLYAFCPAMWLVPEEILIQKPFTRYVAYLVAVVALVHAVGALEIRWAGIAWRDWWRNEQFFMTASLSAYPTALLHMVMKPLTGKSIRFRVTSKAQQQQTAVAEEDDDRYAEMYEMRWVPMLIPAAVVLASNVMAIGVALGKAAVYAGTWTSARRAHAALGLLFNVWMMALLYPFALAVMGRWSRRPATFFVLLPAAFLVFALVYIGVHALLVKFLPFVVI